MAGQPPIQETNTRPLGTHDMRRTCDRLCRRKGGEFEQIQFLFGPAEAETTKLYLGSRPEMTLAANDSFRYMGRIGPPEGAFRYPRLSGCPVK
jgi:hypothetical protein